MHSTQHAGDELVNSITLLYQRHNGRDSAFVIPNISEVGKYEFLKLFNLVLQGHEVADGLVTLVWVVDGLQADILFVFECSVELWVLLMKRELGKQEINIFSN